MKANDPRAGLPARIAAVAKERGLRVAACESLTGGSLCAELAQAPGAGAWVAGGIGAYLSQVKFDLLGVPRGPVVSEAAARTMAEGVARLTGATHTVAVTGVGGPERQDGEPVGTVWIATHADGATAARRLKLS